MKLSTLFIASTFLLMSGTASAAFITPHFDGGALTSNGDDYFVDAGYDWFGTLNQSSASNWTATINGDPDIAGYPSANADFNLLVFFGGLDGTNTSGSLLAMENNNIGVGGNTTDIAGTDFGFSLGHTSGSSWDWIGFDLVFQIEYDMLDGKNFGAYAFTEENWFTTENVVTQSVPEPSIIALFGAGLLGMGIVRRRKAKTS